MLTDYQIPTNTIQINKGQVEDLLALPKHEMLTAKGCMVENHQIPITGFYQKTRSLCLVVT